MASSFLTAEWRNLLMANYEIDPAILQQYLPCYTELDDFEGRHYASLVGFLFKDTKVLGVPVPFHQTFEEVNLRFYVRFREGNIWRRGVVFIKEIVPKHMITFVANNVYGEKYATHPMRHQWKNKGDDLFVSYEWKVGNDWNHLKVTAAQTAETISEGSIEEFITEHYWGYTRIKDNCTGVYEVCHPKWLVHRVKDYQIKCATEPLYGKEFVETLNNQPASVFLADGSPVSVLKGKRLYKK